MFPGDSESPARAVKKAALADKKIVIILSCIAGVCALALLGVLIATGVFGGSTVKVPDAIAQKVQSPIYLPGKLPGNYKVSNNSFDFVEEDKVLVFQAEDGVSGNLVFSEQAKPKDFDFDKFHKGNFEDPKTLSDVPYTSIWGKAVDGRLALSIVTPDTWVLVATSAPLSEDDMTRIASGLQKR